MDSTAFGGSLRVLWMLVMSVEHDHANARFPSAYE